MDYMHLPRGRQKSAALPRLLLAGFIVLLMAGIGFGFYEYKTHPEWVEGVGNYRERLTSWLAERKKNMRHGPKVRSEPEETNEDRTVNFEFYSTLQDMKSMEVEAQSAAQKKMSEKPGADQDAVKPVKKTQQAKVSHAADLEKDLLAAMKTAGDK